MEEEAKSLPKKAKVIISNLHLGKGRFLESGGLNSLEEFYYGDKLVEFLNYYSTGIYKDHEIELILNGDFLNFLQVDYKGHFLTVITEPISLEILKKIIKGHQKVFDAMSAFATKPHKSVTYIIGNHDQSMLWPSCRLYLNQVIGAPIRFKNIIYFFDGFHVEHGHMHEAANKFDPKKFFLKKNLAEPILNLPFGSHFYVELVLSIKKKFPFIDKIRPFSKMINWIFFHETKLFFKSFFSTLIFVIKILFVKDRRRQWSLKNTLKIIFQSAVYPDLMGSAKKILKNDRVHTVIFGHSHIYQYRQWRSEKEYFSVGTWTELTSLDIVSLGKISKLTYVLIDYPEDGVRPRARLKEWKGYYRIEEDVAIS